MSSEILKMCGIVPQAEVKVFVAIEELKAPQREREMSLLGSFLCCTAGTGESFRLNFHATFWLYMFKIILWWNWEGIKDEQEARRRKRLDRGAHLRECEMLPLVISECSVARTSFLLNLLVTTYLQHMIKFRKTALSASFQGLPKDFPTNIQALFDTLIVGEPQGWFVFCKRGFVNGFMSGGPPRRSREKRGLSLLDEPLRLNFGRTKQECSNNLRLVNGKDDETTKEGEDDEIQRLRQENEELLCVHDALKAEYQSKTEYEQKLVQRVEELKKRLEERSTSVQCMVYQPSTADDLDGRWR